MTDPLVYTVKGKGGRYVLINTVTGAGELKGTSYTVYRCLKTNKQFVRTVADFMDRMELVPVELIDDDLLNQHEKDPAVLSTKYILIILILLGLFAFVAQLPDHYLTF